MWQDGYQAGSLCSCSLWFPINTRSLSLCTVATVVSLRRVLCYPLLWTEREGVLTLAAQVVTQDMGRSRPSLSSVISRRNVGPCESLWMAVSVLWAHSAWMACSVLDLRCNASGEVDMPHHRHQRVRARGKKLWAMVFIAKVSLVGGALAWRVLIASCTANSNFVSEFSETLRAPLPKPLAVVKWYRINA